MEQSIKREFVKYVSFNILASIGTSAYVLVDTFFVANGIGTTGLASLNLAITLFSLINAIGMMIGIGGATKFAIEKARKDFENARDTFKSALGVGLSISLCIGVMGFIFAQQIGHLIGADGETIEMTTIYLKTMLSFAPFFIMNNIIVVFVRNDGQPRLVAVAMIIGNVANIILDYIFIYPLEMGMFGAAFATCISPICSMAVISVHFLQKRGLLQNCKVTFFKIGSDVKKIVYLGIFAFVNEMATGVVILVFNLLLLGLGGNMAVAAYGVIANVSIVSIAIFTGISQGIQPIISKTYGAGDKKTSRKVYIYAIVLTLIFSLFLIAIVTVFDREISDLFNKDQNVQLTNIAAHGLKIYFIGFVSAGLNIITAGFMSAIENGGMAFTISFMRGLITIIPSAIILSVLFGINGVWVSFPVAETVTLGASLFFLWKLQKNK